MNGGLMILGKRGLAAGVALAGAGVLALTGCSGSAFADKASAEVASEAAPAATPFRKFLRPTVGLGFFFMND